LNTDMHKFESAQKDESRAQSADSSKAGVPNRGYMYLYPQGYILPIWRGTFKVSNRREKYIYIPLLSKYLYIYQWM